MNTHPLSDRDREAEMTETDHGDAPSSGRGFDPKPFAGIDYARAEELLRDPDAEDCERFSSWFGRELIERAKAADALFEVVCKAWAMMENGEAGPDPINSVCGGLPAGGLECEARADEVLFLLRAAIAKATTAEA